jgi:hypothetical protein
MHPGEVLGEVRPVGVMRWPGHEARPGSSGRVWDRPPASADSRSVVNGILDQRSRDPRPGGLCHTPRDLTGAEQLTGAGSYPIRSRACRLSSRYSATAMVVAHGDYDALLDRLTESAASARFSRRRLRAAGAR